MLRRILAAKKPGFTIIELIVTFAILAILVALGVPIYSKYRIRSKVASMVSAASAAEFAVANDYFNQGYTFDLSNFEPNSQPFLIPPSDVIDSMEVEKGWVRIYGNPDELGGRQINLVFQPSVSNNEITWTCYVSTLYFDFAPEECRNSGCAVYEWSDWNTIDQGTTWMYNESAGNVATNWVLNCMSYDWYFGCSCYNATDTNLVEFDIQHTVIDDVDHGWGWTYLVVNHDCRRRTRELTSQGSCASCPGGATCQDMFAPLDP